MTIVVGVAAPDGLILAADSRMTYMPDGGRDRTRVVSDSTQKVFSLCGRYGVACYGAGFVEDKSVSGQMDEFEASLAGGRQSQKSDVERFSADLGGFFDARVRKARAAAGKPWKAGEKWKLGFLVAGYDGKGVGRLVDVRVPKAGGPGIFWSSSSTAKIGLTWRGQDDVLNRLMGGVDTDLLSKLLDADEAPMSKQMKGALAKLEYQILYPITAQDAVDCAVFLINTTIGMQRFSDGTLALPGSAPACGGPIRVLHVARGGVEWVSRPVLSAERSPGNAECAVHS